jgi:hypothetical protein
LRSSSVPEDIAGNSRAANDFLGNALYDASSAKGNSMSSTMLRLGVLALAAAALSGCAVAEVGGAVIGAGVDVASTAVHVTGDVVGGAADIATGSSDKKSDDK